MSRCLLLLVLLACNKTPHPQPESLPVSACMTPDRAVVVVMTSPEGYLEPCGCTSEPLGGIAKLAAFWAEQRRCHAAPVLVTTGNLLFDAAPLGANREQEETKARLLADIYVQLGAFAQTPGPYDLPHLERVKTRWLRGGEVRTTEAAGLRLAFVGVEEGAPLPSGLPVADAVIALSSRPWQVNRELKGFDVVVSAGGPELRQPQVSGKTLFVEAGMQGQHVGLLELVAGEQADRWTYFDAGAGELSQLRRQLTMLERELAGMEPQAKQRQIQMDRREQLKARIATLEHAPEPPPVKKHVRFSIVPLTRKMPEAAEIKKQIAGYNATLCDSSKRATENLACPQAPSGAATFVGSVACAGCHAPAYKQWETQKHAHAVKTLEDAGKLCDLGCIGCHTTGFNRPGGFCSPQKIGVLKEVGCEMCHGAGSLHVQGGGAKDKIVRAPAEAVCLQCHVKDHSDLFEFNVYRGRILGPGHGR